MLNIVPQWRSGRQEIDPRVIPLLRAVAGMGSLRAAVTAQRLSYRHAWGLLGKAQRALGQPLVRMQRGRGARLSAFAQRLLEIDEAAAALLARETGRAVQRLNRALPAADTARYRPLVVHASHDLALAELRDLLTTAQDVPALDLHFRGSLECLASLARRECEIAGFHLPETPAERAALAPYLPALAIRDLSLVRFVRRRQGLMVPSGNPKRIGSIKDLARKGVRFVNRQPESGTRLCFDRLLAAAQLTPSQIEGYATEEFTHAAVAATVASGMADAGFGIEAAARRHHLDFVTLADEAYLLGARRVLLAQPRVRAFLEKLASPEFIRRVEALPGYGAAGIGNIFTTSELLAEVRTRGRVAPRPEAPDTHQRRGTRRKVRR